VRCGARSGSGCGVVAGPLTPQQHPQSWHIDLCLWYHVYVGRLYELVRHDPLERVAGVEGSATWLELQVGPDWGSPSEMGPDLGSPSDMGHDWGPPPEMEQYVGSPSEMGLGSGPSADERALGIVYCELTWV
jgi:hypothetical protein